MDIELKYGRKTKRIQIPEQARVKVFRPEGLPPLPSVVDAMNHSLSRPLGRRGLEELIGRIRPSTIAVAVPDESRPVPVKVLLPILMERINAAAPGLEASSIRIVIGSGLHPPLDRAGVERVIPQELVPGCRLVSHDALRSRMTDYGMTSRGTPVRINAEFAEADLKIAIGQIDPHQFVGFTGGAKGVVIGCASEASIEHNHSLMFDENALVGRLEGNPVREDLNEAGEIVGIDLAVNVVLDPDKEVVRLLAGDPAAVLTEGAATCAALYGVEIEEKCDIAIASCGGFPKDICLYQAQKGLNLASQAVKEGGKILLLAASDQGVGDDVYLDYVSRFATPQEALDDFKNRGFKMGAHKAYLFGRTLTRYEVAVESELDQAVLNRCHLAKGDAESVLQSWVKAHHDRPLVGVMPSANTTYFYQRQRSSLKEGE